MPKTESKAKPAAKPVKKLSDIEQLEADLKALGCDDVRVWKGDDNQLVYARMTKDKVTRLLSVSVQAFEAGDVAKSLYAQSRF